MRSANQIAARIRCGTKQLKISFLTSFKDNAFYVNIQGLRTCVKALGEDKDAEVRNFARSLRFSMNIN